MKEYSRISNSGNFRGFGVIHYLHFLPHPVVPVDTKSLTLTIFFFIISKLAVDESNDGPQRSALRRPTKKRTTIQALSLDILSIIFSFIDILQLIHCSTVCKSWRTVVDKVKLLQLQYHMEQERDSTRFCDTSTCGERSWNRDLEQIGMDRHRRSLQEGSIAVCQWKGHSVGVDQCRMKMGLILTGVGDKVMRLWSAETYKCLDEYSLPDRAPLIDFDFDESKVVGLVGTRLSIWRRDAARNIISSRESLFTKALCMRYVDPEAVVGCEDGKVRVYDMYSRKCSRIIKMHQGPVTCLSFNDDQLIISGSSLGSISISDLSSDQQVSELMSTNSTEIRSLCLNPWSHYLFAGSSAGNAYCWDLRATNKPLWETRVSPNVLYSMRHLRSDTSALVIGGIDGVLRVVDQDTGEVFSRCILDESSSVSNRSKDVHGVIERKKGKRLPEDARIDLMPKTHRPPITCLAVGMEKVVTTHNDKYIRVWKFKK